MTRADLSRFAGWSAMASAGATVLGLATLLMFYAVGRPWGTINDITSMLLALSSAPPLFALHRHCRRRDATISLTAFIIGVLGLLAAFVFQCLLVLRFVEYAQTAVSVPAALGVFGATLMTLGYLQRRARALPRALAWLAMIAGLGYVFVIAGIGIGGQEHPLAMMGGLMAVVCYPTWAIWFGRMLLLRQINFEGP